MLDIFRTIKGKLFLFLVCAAMGTFILIGISLSTLHGTLKETREVTIKQLAEVGHGVLAHYHRQATENKMSMDEAKAAALTAIKSLRYEGQEYYWINDMQPRMIMHPINPRLDGQDLSSFEDPTGNRLFMEFVRTVRENGRGHVNYLWPKPGHDTPVEKTSYVIGFEPWGWIIGTGVYNDDIQSAFWSEVGRMTIFVAALVIVFFIPMVLLLRAIMGSANRIAAVSMELSQGEGDLTRRLPIQGRDELTEVSRFINAFLEKTQQTVINVRNSVEGVASASEQLSSTSSQMSSSMGQQSETITQIASAIHEMSHTVGEVSRNMGDVENNANMALDAAKAGGEIVQQSTSEMEGIAREVDETASFAQSLEEKSKRVEEVIQVINDIADQTNLLALNAAIEAARAGDAGRGFAVVADEVRKLAERSTNSTQEIIEIVKTIQSGVNQVTRSMGTVNDRVQHGASLSRQADEAFTTVLQGMENLQQLIEQNVAAVEQMAKTSEQITEDVQSISTTSEETAKASEEVAFASRDLARLSADVQHHLDAFKVDDDSRKHSMKLIPRG
ncbi:chemotaxis sensory transducer [Desulfurispirillum indicum S5]|uniref:Chemotaxis sensory transducer n=1 Tax=Desulfurispirillum indicum (strain ATCC BAA-1389 / DSM 22839 / S5) TaxID=653733 RepID=E6W2Y6_DESIS|nr:methyl-accepting chemotaxis protein [Desulfurispirillum indicum]ADU66811.1 chemotaxis sensory transducer [Desulfurispirillum indicum S5]